GRSVQAEPLEKRVPGVDRLGPCQGAAEEMDALELVLGEEQLFAARARLEDLERGEDPPVGQLPSEVELHVPRALEFFEDDVVHPRARLDENGADDGQGSAFL